MMLRRCFIRHLPAWLLILAGTGGALAQTQSDQLLSYWNQGIALKNQGKRSEAIAYYEKAAALAPRVYPANSPDHANLLRNLGELYQQNAQYEKAATVIRQALKMQEANLGPDHVEVGKTLGAMGNVLTRLAQYDQAEQFQERSLKVLQAKLGDHPEVSMTMINLAALHSQKGQHARAEPLLLRAAKMEEASRDKVNLAYCLNELGSLHQTLGRFDQAESLFLRTLQMNETRLGKDHPDVSSSLVRLAWLYVNMGQYVKAEPLYQRALAIDEAKHGKDHPTTANTVAHLAWLADKMGQYEKAQGLYERSLKTIEAKLGKDHRDAAVVLNNLGWVLTRRQQYAAAEAAYLRGLKIQEGLFGPDHLEVAFTIGNLATLYEMSGQYAKAKPLLLRALKIKESKFDKDHPQIATSLHNLGWLQFSSGEYDEAEATFRRSLQLKSARFGQDNPEALETLGALVQLYAAREQWEQAIETADQMRRHVRQHVGQVLPALSEQDQLTFLRTKYDGPLHTALTLALQRRDQADVVARSAGWVINGKAVAEQTLAERTLLLRDGHLQGTADAARQLLAVRKQLATLSLAGAAKGQEAAHRQKLDQLTLQEQELARKIGRAGAKPTTWVELAAVRQGLGAGGVLVEIVRMAPLDLKAKYNEKPWLPARYLAWVIPADEKAASQLIDLGEAKPIDEAVAACRRELQETSKRIRELGEATAEKELNKPLQALAKLVLEPLLPHIGSAPRWVLSPDGELWLVPWAALPLADGSYAVEKHQIRFVSSGRDLAVVRGSAANPNRAVVLADPDYDLGVAEARLVAKKLAASSPDELRSAGPSVKLPIVPRLPGTAAEAQAIAPKLQEYLQAEPMVYQDKQALEGVVKSVRRPRILVLSTHGYFLAVSADAGKGPNAPLPDNPLLRCGLLFAGCNQRGASLLPGDEDGVLTGLEIIGTDLRGTELVVLSACETGLGQIRQGEGVAGLRQAFQLAGAQGVVATLWQIPDLETARLMSDFFGQLAAKKGTAEALREAQLAMIKARRERNGAAHPFFWAAFTLTGQ